MRAGRINVHCDEIDHQVVQAVALAVAQAEPLPDDVRIRDEPDGRCAGRKICGPNHGSFGDDQRARGQAHHVFDDHRTTLGVERHRDKIVVRLRAPCGRSERLPTYRRVHAGRDRAVAMNPGARVGRVDA